MFSRVLEVAITVLSIVLCFFVLYEVNFPHLQPQSQLAVFVMFGLVLCFLIYPAFKKLEHHLLSKVINVLLALGVLITCGYVVVQTEPFFSSSLWSPPYIEGVEVTKGVSLGDRAGSETTTDFVIGLLGLLLILEGTRRSIGVIVPLLAMAFVGHSLYCHLSLEYETLPAVPMWLLPHEGQDLRGLVGTTFLQSLGVFGPAAGVMFRYVFLFVVFGSFLQMSGATQFIIDFAQKVFGKSPGGPAKVSVLGSGLMGSLSGSAVANAVTTGSFTIPMMRNSGFQPHIAGGITAAAASGGALVPPVMGAGAYMMLEIVTPEVTFLQVARAAIIPALLYYFSIFMIVHFFSRRIGTIEGIQDSDSETLWSFEALVFFGALTVLIGLLFMNFTPFRAVTGALILIIILVPFRPKLNFSTQTKLQAIGAFLVCAILHYSMLGTDVENPSFRQHFESWLSAAISGMFGTIAIGLLNSTWRPAMLQTFKKSASNGISLVAASACVGIVIGIVQETGIANDFSSRIKDVVETNLFVALIGIMACSIILGMGVPSVVCYLLMATLMGSLLGELGVIPLAAHLFIFYFGMMSMVTPPVALAAYASASLAQANIMRTALSAFVFSLVGFTLPFMFVYRPSLLLMNREKWAYWMDVESGAITEETRSAAELLREAESAWPDLGALLFAVTAAILGIVALAACIAGFLNKPLSVWTRCTLFVAAVLLLAPDIGNANLGFYANLTGGLVLTAMLVLSFRHTDSQASPAN